MIRLIAIVIGLPLGCALVAGLLVLANTFASSPWVLAVATGAVVLLLGAGTAAAVAIPIYLRAQRLDAVFTPLGLEGGAYQSFFRQYHGTVQERQVDVYLYRGPVLEVEVGTPLQTRLGVTGPHADTRFLAGLIHREPLSLPDAALNDLTIFGADEGWARSLLDNAHAVELLRRLIAPQGSWTRQQVILRPGAWKLMFSGSTRVFGFDLAPDQAQQLLDDLLRLVRIAERLPAPQVTAELTSSEQLAQKLRRQNPYLALWIGLATLVGLLVVGGAITALVLLLDRFVG